MNHEVSALAERMIYFYVIIKKINGKRCDVRKASRGELR